MEEFEKYSPKWLLHKILESGDKHGEALMYIIEFQQELIKNCTIPIVNDTVCDCPSETFAKYYKGDGKCGYCGGKAES